MKRWSIAIVLMFLMGCTSSFWVSKRVQGIEVSLADIREQGISCAPREVAYTEAHLVFAKNASADGRMVEAKAHVLESQSFLKAVVTKSTGVDCDGDRDGDGLVDSVDKCPDIPEDFDNEDDEDGCPEYDRDGDSVPDDRDQCPTEPEDKDKYRDQDGCPDPDNDEDGLPDTMDQCPNRAEDMDDFEDLDGCPENDNDGDGLTDNRDDCPSRKGPASKNGCPDKYRYLIVRLQTIVFKSPIAFQGKSADLERKSNRILNELLQVMKRYPDMTLRIEGYAAKSRLARLRARAILTYLVKRKIERNRLDSSGESLTTDSSETSKERIELHIEMP